ncbi:Low-specificity L-threonine aldolase [Moraxella macacae 0408225]|uniref:Low-specificity L-threonine aldolase n=1 Tax=Moraxella macacae 0408225 TaxID=1230338 RepID=L2F637_9GAMM|nr:beta-eliminating lyase-related protein [Moraxella macacae]ELA08519.1 Low-specificity L-threonine aldolase [Moraxella macacae 0408225]
MKTLHNPKHFTFASDNYSGVHPKILQAIAAANGGHDKAYGHDTYSVALKHLMKAKFGKQASCYLVFNGTGANVLGLQSLLPRCGAVICAKEAHINNDESVAPEYIGGMKLLAIDTPKGKLSPDALYDFCYHRNQSEHTAKASVVYISQTTELGMCYTLDEISSIAKVCQEFDLYFYLDGARLSNALVALDADWADLANLGIDMLSIGGTKNGLMIGEGLIVLNPTLDEQMRRLRKSNMQLGSKLRFVAAQFLAWFEDDLWYQLAKNSNDMANYLYHEIKDLNGVTVLYPVHANAVFVRFLPDVVKQLHEQFEFYDTDVKAGEVRLMTSFDTTKAQVDVLVSAIKDLVK